MTEPEKKQTKEVLEFLERAIEEDDRRIVILSKEEYEDLKKLLEDRKAISRVWSIVKTILIATAATIVAYNTILEGGIKAILNFFNKG